MCKHRRKRSARLQIEAAAIERRLERAVVPNMSGPVLGRANIAYELSQRTKATAHGGIGAIAKLVDNVGLAGAIDCSLELLKLHKPYHLPRVRSRAQHRLQHAVRRPTPPRHRGPPL
jgi:hypothetical protein